MNNLISPYDVLTSSGRYPDRLLYKECTQEVRRNAEILAGRTSALIADFLKHCVSSGFRHSEANDMVGGSKKSNHMKGAALDIYSLAHWLKKDWIENGEDSLLVKHDLYLEDPDYTSSWCHLQTVPPGSGRRVFIP